MRRSTIFLLAAAFAAAGSASGPATAIPPRDPSPPTVATTPTAPPNAPTAQPPQPKTPELPVDVLEGPAAERPRLEALQAERDGVSGAQPEAGPEAEAETEARPEADARTETQTEAEAETEAQAETETATETETEQARPEAARGERAKPEPAAERAVTIVQATADPADLARRAGALLVVGFVGLEPDDPGVVRVRAQLADGRIGGVLLLERNVRSAAQLARLTAALDAAAPGGRALTMVDQEGGQVARLRASNGFRDAPGADEVGVMPAGAADAALERLAETVAAAGIAVNLGPVLDLALAPESSPIAFYGRSFSADPERVARLGRRFVDAHRAVGVRVCAKHFPGHGAARGDTHEGFVSLAGVWSSERDLAPFRALASGDAPIGCVMTSHLAAPALGGGEIVTFAPEAVGHLRDAIDFDGVILTDDLQMRAVAERRGTVAAALGALAAGHDMALVANFRDVESEAPDAFRAGLEAALRDGRLDADALEASLARVAAWRP